MSTGSQFGATIEKRPLATDYTSGSPRRPKN